MQSIEAFKKKLSESGSVQWLSETRLETLWHFEMSADRAAIWKHLSDTSRFNRELGLPPRTETEINGELVVHTSTLGLPQEWIEEPWTWVAEQSISSVRRYKKGLAKTVHSVFQISETPDYSKRIVSIYFGWNPQNIFWSLILKLSESVLQNQFRAAFQKIDALIAKQNTTIERSLLSKEGKSLPQEQLHLLAEKKAVLSAQAINQNCLELLLKHIQEADDFDLESIRLIPLANEWQVKLEDLLVTALYATRAGVLQLSWNVICPHCKGPRLSAAALGELPEKSECEVCDIKFSTDTAEAIEIVFHVHPAIREIPQVVYCAAEPAKKNHIKVQQRLLSGEQKKLRVQLSPGHYRARLQGTAESFELEILPESTNKKLRIENTLPTSRVSLAPDFDLELSLPTQEKTLFIIEELQGKDLALRPGQLLSLPEFRDLFSEEHLRSNVKLYLGEQAVLFTDIVGSTNFYKEVGDAKAFADVQAHFADVLQAIKENRGVLVKTIGDAAMGAYPKIENAMAAAIAIQKKFPENRSDLSIRLRISVHAGPVIGVKLDTGIDYFGSTVNFAAKIQSCAGAHELALSGEAFEHWQKLYNEKFPISTRVYNRDSATPTNVFVAQIN